MRGFFISAAIAALCCVPASLCVTQAWAYVVEEKSISALQADLTAKKVTSEELVKAYLDRIKTVDQSGPRLNSVLALNPDALKDAKALDKERRDGHVRSALHGIPILLKDNIESADPVATTAGSLALKDNVTHRDSPVAARLRAAGAIILGKANLSEWANIRSSRSLSGWSGIGGQVKNAYVLDHGPCGSSAGSGAAAAASLAAGTLGTETDGSVTCPSAFEGLVGLKPTVGLVSRTHIVPISHSQDTSGPMTRSVEDAAILMNAMAGSDPKDPATKDADAHKADYVAELRNASLKGKRLGLVQFAGGRSTGQMDAVLKTALDGLRAAGAEIVTLKDYKAPDTGSGEHTLLMMELKSDMNLYLASTPGNVKTRTLADLIAFNKATPRELVLFGQEQFEQAEATKGVDDPEYQKLGADIKRALGQDGIDKLIAENKLDALIGPTGGPAGRIDITAIGAGSASGGAGSGGGSLTKMAAVTGYPHLTVPMGLAGLMPVGLSFVGPAWSDAKILALGYAYEQASHARVPPRYIPTAEAVEPNLSGLAPLGSIR